MGNRNEQSLEKYIIQQISEALTEIAQTEKDEIYAFSFFIYDAFADPLNATLTLGYNTIEHYRSEMEVSENKGESQTLFDLISTPYDDLEAKWNYAFWLQNEIVNIGTHDDEKGKELIRNWIKEIGLYYTEEESFLDFDACMDKARKVTKNFIQILVRVVKQLHKDHSLKVPVIIHELEAFDGITEVNIQANGKSLVKEFLDTYGEYQHNLYEFIFFKLLGKLEEISETNKDIYAYFLFVNKDEEDLRWPTAILRYNTTNNSNVQIKNAGSEQEAKWNHAYCLQDNLLEIGTNKDLKGREIIEKWTKYTELHYTNDEYIQNFEECLEKGNRIKQDFIKILVSVVRSVHQIKKLNIPVIIHEPEYDKRLTDLNIEANGFELSSEFVTWIETSA